MFEALTRDLKYALRGLGRSPGFTIAMVVSLAVGVGGNVATLSILDRLLFQAPAGVANPGELRRLYVNESRGNRPARINESFSVADFTDIAAGVSSRARVAAYVGPVRRAMGTESARVTVSYAAAGFFDALGVRAYRGRLLTAAESDSGRMSPAPAVIGYDMWQSAFGGDSSILGRQLSVEGNATIVVGVMPSGFAGLDLEPVDIWLPAVERAAAMTEPLDRNARVLSLVVRSTDDRAWAEILGRGTSLYRDKHRSDAGFDRNARLISAPLLAARGPIALGPLQEQNLSLAKRLTIVSICVLLVTTFNAGVLLLMRIIRRRREIAVRMALGMSRTRMIGQLLAENTLLMLGSTAASVLLAWWGSRALRSTLLTTVRTSASGIDQRIVVMGAGVAILCCVALAFVPVIASRRLDANALRLDSDASDRTGSRARFLMLVVQTGLCVVLVSFAGAFLDSVRRIATTPLGFDSDRLILVSTNPGQAQGLPDAIPVLGQLPSVESVARSMAGIMSIRGGTSRFMIRGAAPVPDDQLASFDVVEPSYFATVGIPLVAGRLLSSEDRDGTEPVIVITEAIARTFWRDQNPLNQCAFVLGIKTECRRIVGVVRDIRWDLSGLPQPHYYLPAAQNGAGMGRHLVVRTRRAATASDVAAIDRAVRGAIPDTRARVVAVTTLLEPQVKPLRAASVVFLVFGALALFAAAAGAYGLVSYEISQRTRELGVRLALGAGALDVARIVVRSSGKMLAFGLAGGLVAAVASGRFVAAFLFDTHPSDPRILGAVVVTIVGAAALAMLAPTIRAVRLDPAAVLRND